MFLLKNLNARILKFFLALIIAVFSWWNFSQLPWYTLVELNLRPLIGHSINLIIQKSNGKIISRNFEPNETTSSIKIMASKLLFIKVVPPIVSEISFKANNVDQKLSIHEGMITFPFQEPMNRNDVVFESYTIIAVLIFFLSWIVLEFLSLSAYRSWLQHAGLFALHISLVTLLFWGSFPGLFGWDTFVNYSAALSYYTSVFVGDLYLSLLMIVLQYFPESWVISLLNSAVILCCLTALSSMAIRLKAIKYYFLGLALFFLYPINPLISMFAVRDIISFWFFNTTLLCFYYSYVTDNRSFKSYLTISVCTIITCLMRQEAFLVLLPGLVITSYFFHKTFFRSSLVIVALTVCAHIMINIIAPNPMEANNYQTTLLINPLSYILKEKYPTVLPKHVIDDLGPYFKSDYLVKYQIDFEIDPFHKGGVNFETSEKDFIQFRNAAIKIILSNPWLFLKNRTILASYLFGFNNGWSFAFEDKFFNNWIYFADIKSHFPTKPDARPKWSFGVIEDLQRIIHKYPIIFCSYLLPLLVIVGLLLIRPFSPFFASLCAILGARTLVVCLTAPAGYFKYLYPLWLFAPFVLFLFMAERKLRLTKTTQPSTTL